jgi:hypothetical protein
MRLKRNPIPRGLSLLDRHILLLLSLLALLLFPRIPTSRISFRFLGHFSLAHKQHHELLCFPRRRLRRHGRCSALHAHQAPSGRTQPRCAHGPPDHLDRVDEYVQLPARTFFVTYWDEFLRHGGSTTKIPVQMHSLTRFLSFVRLCTMQHPFEQMDCVDHALLALMRLW